MKFEFSEIIGLCTEVNEWILRVQESFHIKIYENICRHIVLNSELVGGYCILFQMVAHSEFTVHKEMSHLQQMMR